MISVSLSVVLTVVSHVSALLPPRLTDTPAAARQGDRATDALPLGARGRLGPLYLRHPGNVTAAAFSPDGTLLASADDHGDLRLWTLPCGTAPTLLPGVPKTTILRSVAYSPDGHELAGVSVADLYLWCLAPRADVRVIHLGKPSPERVRFSPSGDLVAIEREDGIITLLRPSSGEIAHTLAAQDGSLLALTFSPDGTQLAAAYSSGAIRFWEAKSGRLIRSLCPRIGSVRALGYRDRTGNRLVVVAQDGLYLLYADARKPLRGFPLQQAPVLKAAIAPDGCIAAIADLSRSVAFCLADTGQIVARVTLPSVNPAALLVFSGDGKRLLITQASHTILLSDVATPRLNTPGHQNGISAVAFSPDGRLLATTGSDSLRLWDSATGVQLWATAAEPARLGAVTFSPGGSMLLTGGQEIRIWDTTSGREVKRLPIRSSPTSFTIALSQDARLLAAAGPDRWVRLWTLPSCKPVKVFEAPPHRFGPYKVSAVCFSSSESLLLVASEGDVLRLYDVPSGRCLREWSTGHGLLHAAAFSPLGRALATAGSDGEVRLWDVASGRIAARLRFPQARPTPLWAVAFSPDGRLVAAGGATVGVWESASCAFLHRFSGHSGDVRALAFSPDSRRLASGSDDTTCLIWDLTFSFMDAATKANPTTKSVLQQSVAELGSSSALVGQRARWRLIEAPSAAVDLLRKRLQPARSCSGEQIEALISKLASGQFHEREQASRDLEGLEERASPLLTDALGRRPPLEVRRRIEGVLRALEGPPGSVVSFQVHAVSVLEACRTPEATDLLIRLASGDSASRLTKEARRSLGRLSRGKATELSLRALRSEMPHPATPAAAVARLGGTVVDESAALGETWVRVHLGTDVPAVALSHVLLVPGVRALELSGPQFGNDSLQTVGRLTGLRRLSLRGTSVTDRGLAALTGLSDLESLDLEDTGVTDAGLVHLAHARRLVRLSLGQTQVTGAGLHNLSAAKGLRAISFRWAESFGNGGLQALTGLAGLEEVDLRGTHVTDEGLFDVARLSHLRALDLSMTRVSDDGLRHLSRMAYLKYLRLENTRIQGSGFNHLASVPNLRALDLRGCSELKPDALRGLKGCRALQRLDLSSTSVGDGASEIVAGCTHLRWVSLSQTRITDSGLRHIGSLQRLRWLGIRGTHVSDVGLGYIGGLTGLRGLDAGRTRIGDKGIHLLLGLKTLEEIAVDETRVGDTGLQDLASFPRLRILDIDRTGTTNTGIIALERASGLEDLSLEDTTVTGRSISRLVSLPRLRVLRLSRSLITDRDLECLPRFRCLEKLYLDETDVTDRGLAYVGAVGRLRTLSLNGTRVTDVGLAFLLPCRRLQSLDVSCSAATSKGSALVREALVSCLVKGP